MKKENVMPAVVLTAICLVVALALAAVNLFTAPKIEEAEAEAFRASLSAALPDGTDFEEVTFTAPDGSSVKALYRETSGKGYVVSLETTKGYTGKPIAMTVGITTDGKVAGVVVTKTGESKINKEIKAYPDTFVGTDAESAGAVDTVAGVTFSSRAYRKMITEALEAVKGGAD